MSVPTEKTPYLRVQRTFPQDPQALSVEISRAYIDIAQNVNKRTIGIFANVPLVTGDTWFLNGGNRKQQTLRQVYTITGTGSYEHGITLSNISGFTKIYGTFVDNAGVWYPLPYVDSVNADNQISVVVNSTHIVITAGGGSPPAIASGFVVLEWLSNVSSIIS